MNILLGSKSGVEFEIKGCKMSLTKTDCKISLLPAAETCGGKIPLNYLLDHFFPKNDIGVKTKTFLLPEKFDLKSLEINSCETTIKFETIAREKIDLITNKIKLDGVTLAMTINYKTGVVDWEKMTISINGVLELFGKKIQVVLNKKSGENELKFSFQTDQITIPNFLKMFTDKPVTPATADKAVGDTVNGLIIKSPKVSGLYDPSGFYELVLKGEPNGEAFKSSTFYGIVQKPPDGDVKAGLVGSFALLSPSILLSAITGKDLTDLPLIKNAVLNFALEVASDSILVVKDEELSKALSSFVDTGKTICKGAKLKFDLPVKEILRTAVPDIKTDDLPTSLFMKVYMDADGLKFKFPDTWKTDLLKILKAFAPKAKEYLPKWLQSDSPSKVQVNAFSFDYKTMTLNVNISAPGPFKVGNILSLSNVELVVSHKDDNSPWEFSFSSTQKLFNSTTMTTSLSKKGENSYEFTGTIDLISTGQLVEYFSAKVDNEETMTKLKFLDFGVKGVKITSKFGDKMFLR